MKMVEAKADNYRICCTSCQEDVNVHPCTICGEYFEPSDIIECEHHSHTDCQHVHKRCGRATKFKEDDKPTKGAKMNDGTRFERKHLMEAITYKLDSLKQDISNLIDKEISVYKKQIEEETSDKKGL